MAVKHTIRKNGDGDTKEVKLTSLTAIRAFCLECLGWSPNEVTACTAPLCPLFPFRSGHNPARKGIGGDIAFKVAKVAVE